MIEINVSGLCPKCIEAAMRQPAPAMYVLGYFMWAAHEEFQEAGEVPTLDSLSDVAFLAAARYMSGLRGDEAIAFRDRFKEECNYADQASNEDLMHAITTAIPHLNESAGYIN